jgi:predicted HD phosphohydrolase
MNEIISSQRALLRKKEETIKTENMKQTQIKTITQELLQKLNESYQSKPLSDEDQLSQIDSRSETSSVADEKEIHSKLKQILHILNQQKAEKHEGEEEEHIQPHTERMVKDVFDEASTEELQLYVFQANEIGGTDQQ